jgi:hypothetical protein
MVDEQNVEGSVQNNSENPQVMNEQEVAPVVENQEVAQPQAETQAQEAQVAKIDPDEKILSDMFDSGKTEVSMNELVTSGFNTLKTAEFAFEVGSFRLSRLFPSNPYKIEKKQ